jgi:ATPase family associated with various cellular activities (AAA)
MRNQQRELISTLHELRRDAARCLAGFTRENGGLGHHPTESADARKTTLRAARFFMEFPTETFGSEKQERLRSYASTSMAKTVLSDDGSGLYDKQWALMVLPFHSKDPDPDVELVKCVERLKGLEYLRETGETAPSAIPREWPHTTFLHLFDQLIARFQAADRGPLGIDLNGVQLRVRSRCAEELYKQCAVFGADVMGYFDAAKMAFALAPSLHVVPPELSQHALGICAQRLADAPNQIFSPYWIVSRDKYFRPLLEEVVAALLGAALQLLELRRAELDCVEGIARLIHVVAERALIRKKRADGASGWTAIDGPYRPEAWPTLAVGEFAAIGEAFLGRYTLFRLRAEYGFTLRRPDQARFKWSEYWVLPFDVHGAITQNMLNDGGDWRSAILFGPPGTGKTSLVHAIAKEKGFDLVIITPADVAQDGPDRIIARARELLDGLSDAERVVVFLDEFEPFVRSRAKEGEEMWMSMITNSMLPLLQQLRERSSIYCFLATNFASKLDRAATREGRFDALLPVWPPALEARRRLIEGYTNGPISDSELREAAVATKGCTVGELQAMSKRRNWSGGASTGDLPDFDCELDRARPPLVGDQRTFN